jgi:hypothetical protein
MNKQANAQSSCYSPSIDAKSTTNESTIKTENIFQDQKESIQKKEMDLEKVLMKKAFIITFSFFGKTLATYILVCWTPYLALVFYEVFSEQPIVSYLDSGLALGTIFNSMINPLLIIYSDGRIRANVKEFLLYPFIKCFTSQ